MRARRGGPIEAAFVAAMLFAGVVTAPRVARGEERSDARAAYDDAARAYEAKDFARAAQGFARADALAPNALALKLALAAALQANDPLLAEELAARAESRDTSTDVQELARRAHRFAADRVGRIRLVCARPGGCVATIGDRKVHDGETAVVARGLVDVVITSSLDRTTPVQVDVTVGGVVTLEEPGAADASRPSFGPTSSAPGEGSRPSSGGLSPAWFWIGVGITAASTGGTIASGVDANSRYDDFEALRTEAARDTGRAAELRTNVLLGTTIAFAVATGIIGVWLTKWSAGHSPP